MKNKVKDLFCWLRKIWFIIVVFVTLVANGAVLQYEVHATCKDVDEMKKDGKHREKRVIILETKWENIEVAQTEIKDDFKDFTKTYNADMRKLFQAIGTD